MTAIRLELEPVRGTGGQRYRVSWKGQTLIDRSRDPEHEVARILRALGVLGPMQMFVCGRPSMILDIESAARLTVSETDRGLRLVKWQPIDPGKLTRLRISHAGLHEQTAKQDGAAPATCRI